MEVMGAMALREPMSRIACTNIQEISTAMIGLPLLVVQVATLSEGPEGEKG